MEWVDKLIIEYEQGRKELRQMHDKLGDSEQDEKDKSEINSMINDMTFSLEWMKTGTQPDMYLGIDKHGAYQTDHIANMDWFPSLDIVPERKLTEQEKQDIFLKLVKLSARERVCFVLREGYLWEFHDIAEELGVSKQTVHIYFKRARKKLGIDNKKE
ncbi:sigma factor-like helix-turn-helix DNA-binding protein [Virgibacillus siamensis]|uniref:sigma factor-like helix-turn-helix DNA-binding protein n=1 Tax=Virgibacillus siamensis TaxID=480071 RepID=UPI0009840EBD|nr:sigma factor-like helix-turn-helix DNA-binding protein [Virgibacillus siamensis]